MGLCQAIELYLLKNDDTVAFLLQAITNINQFSDLSTETLLLFKKVSNEGLPASKSFITEQLNFYKQHYDFE